jgi:uncharacterized protein (DUF2384 family)
MQTNQAEIKSQEAATLSKALIRAASLLHIRQASVARILGISQASASRLFAGSYLLNPERGKEWEFAVLLIRLFRSLDAMIGHGENAQKWLTGNNLSLAGRPIDLIETTEGLIRVLHYVDAYRGRI